MKTFEEAMKFFSESPSPEPLIPLDVPVKLKQTSKRHHTEETKVKKTFDYEDQPTDDDLDEYRLTEANTGFKIDIPLNKGNVYGLVGRNGIGKSTLLKRLKKQGGAHLLHQETMGCTQTVSEILKAPSNIFKGKKELLTTPVEKMSGGWIRRVFIERALQSDSAMILLDEPTNMLDMEGIAYLEDQIRRKRDKIFVIVSHDKEFLSNVCNFILFLSDEIKCYRGNYDTFVKNWTIERNEKIGRYKKEKANREHLQTFINRFRANASMAAQAQSKLKILAKMGPLEPIRDEIAVVFKMNGTRFAQKMMFESFRIEDKSRIIIVGPNGAGKTTFLNKLMEMVPSHGYFKQIFDLPRKTVHEYLISQGATGDEAFKLARDFGLTQDFSLMDELSGGQKSRVVLASISLKKPSLLILDEPTNHLDMESIDALKKMIENYEGAVICVSHDLRFIEGVFSEIYEINNGIRHFKGTIREYKNSLKI